MIPVFPIHEINELDKKILETLQKEGGASSIKELGNLIEERYVEEAKKLDPKIVIPYHFDPETEFDLAKGLRDKLRNNGIKSEILEIGEIVELKL